MTQRGSLGETMQAGKKLDAEIAEKVMGRDMTKPAGFKYPIGLPHYSTAIAAAWEVIERVDALGLGWMLVIKTRGRYLAYCADPDFGDWMAHGDTAPEAICRAALDAAKPTGAAGL